MSTGVSLSLDEVLDAPVLALLSRVGMAGDVTLQQLRGGANNRVYRLDDARGERVVIKHYFRHPHDPRDRLHHEVSFARLARERGLTAGPEVLAEDAPASLAVFRFIDARNATQDDVTPDGLDAMLRFILHINAGHHADPHAEMPPASEACFSHADHHALITRRVQRLIEHGDAEVAGLARQRMLPILDAHRLTDTTPTPRILSPSDLGWHNTLIEPDGTLRLIDFEYAGYDDPAKLVCDLFMQPRFPVPRSWLPRVVHALTPLDATLGQRVRALWPLYAVKWGCILLNAFVGVDADRRRFARADGQLAAQLRLVRHRLAEHHLPVGAAA